LTLTTCSDGTTTIRGPVVDQSALHGLLQRVRDLGLPLISVTRVEPDQLIPSPPSPANAEIDNWRTTCQPLSRP
jgi:hypothetical protein